MMMSKKNIILFISNGFFYNLKWKKRKGETNLRFFLIDNSYIIFMLRHKLTTKLLHNYQKSYNSIATF